MKQSLLLVGTVIINVIGQVAMKRGMTEVGPITSNLTSLPSFVRRTFSRPYVLFGLATYALGTFLWLAALSRFDLSIAYPVLSLGYVIVVFVSWLLLREKVSPRRWLGVLIICTGVYLVSTG